MFSDRAVHVYEATFITLSWVLFHITGNPGDPPAIKSREKHYGMENSTSDETLIPPEDRWTKTSPHEVHWKTRVWNTPRDAGPIVGLLPPLSSS